jgi:hypothetical protein
VNIIFSRVSNRLKRAVQGEARYSLSYFLVVTAISLACIAMPKCNFDGVFYSALASGSNDPLVLQRAGIDFLSHQRDQSELNASSYEKNMMINAGQFNQQLPFYSVKPLYVLLLRVLHICGAGWRSGAIISAICYFLLGVVVHRWLGAHYAGLTASLYAACLMLNPTLLQIVRWTSPDLVSTLISVVAMWCILELKKPFSAAVLLLTGIWVRPETVVFCSLVFLAILLSRMMAMIWVFCLEAMAAASYVFISRFAYPIAVLFYVSIVNRSFAPNQVHFTLTPQIRLHYFAKGVQELVLTDPFFSIPVLLVAAIFTTRKGRNPMSVMIATASVASFAIAYAVFPHFEGRYYISLLVFIPLLIFLCCGDPIDSSLMPIGQELESPRTRVLNDNQVCTPR